jgi:murein DD-endopeptidase MepM/ murein hydrolase activator NlpD
MKQPYFIVVLAHSLHGRLRRVHIPHHVIYVVLGLALLGCFSVVGFLSSYARMAWKVASYNSLRREADALRSRYRSLEKENKQAKLDLATLQLFASEVSTAYGLKERLQGPPEIVSEARLVPTFDESLEQYNFLKSTNFSKFRTSYASLWQTNMRPSIWPVDGRFLGSYGWRGDPFSGQQAFHTGVDLSAPVGSPVRVTADGVVLHAEWSGRYGRLVVVDHGRGVQTYYAHLSRIDVIAGQAVRSGEVVGALGGSGRVTAPHLHYEVRVGGSPINPYNYLAKASVARTGEKDIPF